MLEALLTVAQNIFADVTEVDVQFAIVAFGVRQRRIHQPELDILDIRFLEVRVVEFAHDTAPTLLRVREFTVGIDFTGVDIVRTALFGVVTEVQQRQTYILVRSGLTLRRVDLVLINNTRTMVTESIQVVLDMSRRVRLRVAEDRVHVEPVNQRPVAVVTRVVAQLCILGIELPVRPRVVRCGSQEPVVRIVHVDIDLRRLEVVHIRRSGAADIFCVTRNKVCKLGIHLEGRRCSRGNPRDLVNRVTEPLHLGFPTGVHTPNRIRERLMTGVDFGRQWFLAQVHQRTADYEVFVELIFQVHAEQALTLHREGRLVLEFALYVRAGLQDRLVQNRHRTHRVIDRIIDVLYQFRTSSRYGHTSARHVHRSEVNLAAVRALVLTFDGKLVLLCHLLRNNEGRVVQFLEHVLVRQLIVADLRPQETTERLQYRENDSSASRQNRITFDIVELTVRRRIVTAVQAVELHHAQQLFTLDLRFRQILNIRTDRVVAVVDV